MITTRDRGTCGGLGLSRLMSSTVILRAAAEQSHLTGPKHRDNVFAGPAAGTTVGAKGSNPDQDAPHTHAGRPDHHDQFAVMLRRFSASTSVVASWA